MFGSLKTNPQKKSLTGSDADTQLQVAQEYFQRTHHSIIAAKYLSENSEQLIQDAVEAVSTAQSSGYQYFSTPEGASEFAHGIGVLLRIISYCLIAGGTQPMDDLLGYAYETNRSFELYPGLYIEALNYIKENHKLTKQSAIQADTYIDYLINLTMLN